jgi:hypothetical protein
VVHRLVQPEKFEQFLDGMQVNICAHKNKYSLIALTMRHNDLKIINRTETQ